MKKNLLSLVVALAAIIANNQSMAQGHVGIKTGLTLTTLGAATVDGVSINYQNRTGWQIGIFTVEKLSESVLFSPQLLYTQKGGNLNTTISGVNILGYTQLNYLDVPLLLGFKLTPKVTFLVGPQVSFLSSQKTSVTVTGAGSATNTDTDFLKRTLIGGNLGVGYNFTEHASLNINYVFDFSTAANGKVTTDTGEKNRGFLFTVGYLF